MSRRSKESSPSISIPRASTKVARVGSASSSLPSAASSSRPLLNHHLVDHDHFSSSAEIAQKYQLRHFQPWELTHQLRHCPVVDYEISNTLIAWPPADDHECTICLEAFQKGDRLRLLLFCQHWFHRDCIDTWFLGALSAPECFTRSCPVCNKEPTLEQEEGDKLQSIPPSSFCRLGNALLRESFSLSVSASAMTCSNNDRLSRSTSTKVSEVAGEVGPEERGLELICQFFEAALHDDDDEEDIESDCSSCSDSEDQFQITM